MCARRFQPSKPARLSLASGDQGSSLVELLVATLLFSLVMGSVYGLLGNSQVFFERENANQSVRQETRMAFGRLLAELQLAGYALENVPDTILSAKVDELSFAGDIDDGDVAEPCADESGVKGVEQVTYRLSKQVLERSVSCWDGNAFVVSGAWSAVLNNVASANVFRYFNASGVELAPGMAGLDAAQRAAVTSVQVTLEVRDTATDTSIGSAAATHPEARFVGEAVLRNVMLRQ